MRPKPECSYEKPTHRRRPAARLPDFKTTVATGIDRVATGIDRVATGIDRVATGIDRGATGIDRVATGIDRVALEHPWCGVVSL